MPSCRPFYSSCATTPVPIIFLLSGFGYAGSVLSTNASPGFLWRLEGIPIEPLNYTINQLVTEAMQSGLITYGPASYQLPTSPPVTLGGDPVTLFGRFVTFGDF